MLTLQRAFELFQELYGPEVEAIYRSNEDTWAMSPIGESMGCISYAKIDWGDKTEYRPPRWRQVTKEDVIRSLRGEDVQAVQVGLDGCRVPVKLLGYREEGDENSGVVWIQFPNGGQGNYVLEIVEVCE